MNIVQLHERVRFWVDIVSSTRFDSQDIDNALNIAIDNKWRESYDQSRVMNKSDAFQRVQRIRDELGPLVRMVQESDSEITLSSNEILINDEKYGYLLALEVGFGDEGMQPAFPMTHDRLIVNERNPYRRKRTSPNSKVYYYEQAGIEENEGKGKIIIDHAFTSNPSDVNFYYLSQDNIVNYGTEYDGEQNHNVGDIFIAVTNCTYRGTVYTIGSKFTILSSELDFVGTAVKGYTECKIRPTTHEEISRRAAINCLLTAKEVEKANALRQEIMTT
jgi:hypothetical protein